MKDDLGSYAVFTEQGPSASLRTAAKVLDFVGLIGCAGQASDAVISLHPSQSGGRSSTAQAYQV